MLRFLLSLLLLLFTVRVTYALDPNLAITQYGHDLWDRHDGLPASAIYQISPSRAGYLLLATNAGLIRFDGVSFKNIPISKHQNAEREGVNVILETESGALWIGTQTNGLRVLELGNIKEFGKPEGLEEEIRVLFRSLDGRIWIGTANGLFVYSNQQFQQVPTTHDYICGITQTPDGAIFVAHHGGIDIFHGANRKTITRADGLLNLRVWAIGAAHSGSVWVGTEQGIQIWQNGRFNPLPFRVDKATPLASSFCEDKDGNMWMGTRNGGIYRFTNSGWSQFTKLEGLTNNSVFSLTEDREGSLWIATGEGLNRLRNVNIIPFTTQEGLASENLRSIVEGKDGSLYFLNDVATYISLRKNGRITSIPGIGGPSFVSRDGTVWVAGTAGLQQIRGTEISSFLPELKGRWISCIAEDDLSIIFYLDKVGLRRFIKGKIEPYRLSDGSIYENNEYHSVLFQDSKGTLWAGTTRGVVRFSDGNLTEFTKQSGLPDNFITSIEEAPDGSIWFSTMRGGLARYRESKFTSYSTAQGLDDNQIFRVLDDHLGHLWLSTPRGISVVSSKEISQLDAGQTSRLSPRLFGIADGMKTDRCTFEGSHAGWRTRDGMLWFATAKGAVMVNPQKIVMNTVPPPVFIEQVHVDGKIFPYAPNLQFSAGTRDIEINYTGLSLLAPGKVQFKYKLVGFDHDWITANTRRQAFYTNLPPGTYTFHVMACNNDGVWGETQSPLTFQIHPHFWQTRWFYLLCLLSFLFLAYSILKWRMHQLKLREVELSAHVATRTQELRLEIKERQRAEENLYEAQQFLNSVLDNVPSLIFVKDSEGKFTLANRALATMYGTTPDAMIGKAESDFNHHSDEVEQINKSDLEVLQGQTEKIIPEEKLTNAQGQVRWYQVSKRPLFLEGTHPTMLIGVATDFTDRRLLETQLRHAQKMESIGQIAAGVAHEINTPTQFVGDNTRFVREAFQDVQLILEKFTTLLLSLKSGIEPTALIADIEREMEKVEVDYLTAEIPAALIQSLDGVSRIANIVQSMKDFAHPGATEKLNVDINRAIQSTVTVARNEWKYVAETELFLDESLPLVPCYASEFNQVILNMIINSVHAIEEVVGHSEPGKGKITISTKQLNSQWIEVRISDTGKGIPAEIRSRIFDPFFTTKIVGKGTGQGLAISHAVIVEKHKGQIEVESQLGVGTTFILRLPLDTD